MKTYVHCYLKATQVNKISNNLQFRIIVFICLQVHGSSLSVGLLRRNALESVRFVSLREVIGLHASSLFGPLNWFQLARLV